MRRRRAKTAPMPATSRRPRPARPVTACSFLIPSVSTLGPVVEVLDDDGLPPPLVLVLVLVEAQPQTTVYALSPNTESGWADASREFSPRGLSACV